MTLILSLNEIRAEAEKGIRGVACTWGQAKDGGMIAAWMAGHDLPFLGALNQCLDYADQAEDLSAQATKPDYIAAFDGLMLIEYVSAIHGPWTGTVMMPRFLVGAMAIVAAEQKCSFTLKNDSGDILAVADRDQCWIKKSGIVSGTYQITITPDHADISGLALCPWADQMAHQASVKCWQSLGRFAARTYVPETEEKRRAGAGAGDIDNS